MTGFTLYQLNSQPLFHLLSPSVVKILTISDDYKLAIKIYILLQFILKKNIMAFGTLLWKSVILTSVALLLGDIAGIGSAPQKQNSNLLRACNS